LFKNIFSEVIPLIGRCGSCYPICTIEQLPKKKVTTNMLFQMLENLDKQTTNKQQAISKIVKTFSII
jgi:hypothetical protein